MLILVNNFHLGKHIFSSMAQFSPWFTKRVFMGKCAVTLNQVFYIDKRSAVAVFSLPLILSGSYFTQRVFMGLLKLPFFLISLAEIGGPLRWSPSQWSYVIQWQSEIINLQVRQTNCSLQQACLLKTAKTGPKHHVKDCTHFFNDF